MLVSKITKIYARRRYNRTGWNVTPGKRYALRATGRWKDFFISCGPAGYASPPWLVYLSLLERYRRVPAGDWFTLIGFIDSGDADDEQQAFVIGAGLGKWSPERVGELVCYANDLPGMYWNNIGLVTLELRELSQ